MWWIFGIGYAIEDAVRSAVMGGVYSRRRRERIPVPDVRDRPFDEAWDELVLAGFDVQVTRLEPHPAPVMGVVVDQHPPPGTIARRSARVHVTVLHPPRPQQAAARRPRRTETIEVPDVRGVSFAEAWERLMRVGFIVRLDRSGVDPRPVVGVVVEQEPRPGSAERRGTKVRLTVRPTD